MEVQVVLWSITNNHQVLTSSRVSIKRFHSNLSLKGLIIARLKCQVGTILFNTPPLFTTMKRFGNFGDFYALTFAVVRFGASEMDEDEMKYNHIHRLVVD